jgi:excisionase family DNA binding protein
MKNSPALEPEGLSITQACAIAGIGRSKLYQAIKERRLKARKFGARTIILRTDLRRFLASLPTAA